MITGQLKQKPRLNPNDSMFSATSTQKKKQNQFEIDGKDYNYQF